MVLLFLHILRTREADVHRWLDMIVFLLVDAEYVARWSVVSIVRVDALISCFFVRYQAEL